MQASEADLDFHREHFESIQALRGIAALFVVLEHIRFLNCGAFGVDIFFVISGFMIMFSTESHPGHFLQKRFLRVLPLYYLMTIGTFFLLVLFPDMFQQSRADPSFLLKSLLFIPFEIGDGAVQPLMRIGWTVNCEIFFYVLFFAAMKINHKYRGLICSLFLLVVTGTAQLTAVLLPEEWEGAFVPLSFYGNPIMLEFIFGILVYYAARELYRRFSKMPFSRMILYLSMACVFGCFLALLATKPFINVLGYRRPVLWGLPAAAITLGTFVAGLYIRKLPFPLVQLGNASFSLYLMHYYPVMLLDRMVFDFSACTPYALFGTVVAIAVSVALALVSHKYLEKKLGGILIAFVRKKTADP